MKRDIAYPTVIRMRMLICEMNGVLPCSTYVPQFHHARKRYERTRLELAKIVCGSRPEIFAWDRKKCQAVLDTIDQFFLARG